MDDRSPKPVRGGFKPTVGAGIRGASPLSAQVRERLLNDPAWSFFAQNGKWLCPYCLSAVVKRQGRSREDSIALHLEGCRAYSAGRGQAQNQAVVAERMHFENMTFQAENNPSWRVYDHEGVWYCPSCLERTMAVRLQGGQLNNFVFQAMAGHLRVCASYRQGVIYAVDEVQRSRDLASRAPGLAQVVAAQLQFSVWRYVDRSGAWICPCCLQHVGEVVIRDAGDWNLAIDGITKHLLLRCPSFSPDRLETQPEPMVQQAAAAVPSAANPTPTGVTKIQQQSIPQRSVARRAPPVARPASGAQQHVSGAQPTVRPPMEADQTRAAPEPGRPGYRRSVSLVVPPIAPIATPPPAAPIATPPPAAQTAPVGPLFGDLSRDPLRGTALDRVGSDRVTPTPSSGRDIKITDLDDAIPDGGVREPTPHSRTDVIHARNLQANLFAQSPDLVGYKFATRYAACSDITGDFYEFVTIGDGRIGFALGDVSGHGVQAGLIMSMAKKTLEIYASLGAGPVDTLAKVNDALTRDLGGKMFISMIYGILDPETRRIHWARAGGTPGLRFNANRTELREIRPPGMVLGMKAGAIFKQSLKEEVTELEAGDTILLYTDGVTETMNAEQEEWGTERLSDLIRAHAASGPEALLAQVLDDVAKFRGSLPVADDMTLLALAVE